MGDALRKVGELIVTIFFAILCAYLVGYLSEMYLPLAPLLESVVLFTVPLKGVTWITICIPIAIFMSVMHWLLPHTEPKPLKPKNQVKK